MTISIDIDEFKRGYKEFQKREPRDAMYKIAVFIISHFWGNPALMADGLGVLLLTWNQAFYRYGSFDFDKLEQAIDSSLRAVENLRKRELTSLEAQDEARIKSLFGKFLNALRIATGKKKGTKSPVAVAKALHLLAPGFFPLWDDEIARAYHCHYSYKPEEKYLSFCYKIKEIAVQIPPSISMGNKTLLKLIDEYNYAKYTKEWI